MARVFRTVYRIISGNIIMQVAMNVRYVVWFSSSRRGRFHDITFLFFFTAPIGFNHLFFRLKILICSIVVPSWSSFPLLMDHLKPICNITEKMDSVGLTIPLPSCCLNDSQFFQLRQHFTESVP